MTPKNNLPMIINQQPINVTKIDGNDYICLTDMAKSAGSDRALHSWLRTKNTIDFLGFWEQINNSDFKLHEFVYFKNNAGANNFMLLENSMKQATCMNSLTNMKKIIFGTT